MEEELPPDEYYEALALWMAEEFPKADPALLEHLVPVVAAFDTATSFALSFGIAKFQLAQEKVKLVGEIVGREGRSPNPAIVRAIEKWPPVNTLKDLQAFLGTCNYVRAHAGPAFSRVASPLRVLLRPGAKFPPNEEQLKAIEEIKKLVLEDHVLAVPDEFAAITAANRWLQGEAPGGRPYEMAADTSGYAIGGVIGQRTKDGGKLRVLGYYSAHLSPCQQRYHLFEQELLGLLFTRRDMIKHLGRIPAIIHTDHANIARVEGLPLERVEPKHFRWNSELRQGGSRLLHRPGLGTSHKAPDGISRHPEGRDRLVLARTAEWDKYRAIIKGVDDGIEAGEFDDDEPAAIEIDSVPEEALLPVPYGELLAAGALEEPAKEAIKQAVAKAKARAREAEGVATIGQASSWRAHRRVFESSTVSCRPSKPLHAWVESAGLFDGHRLV